MTDLYSISVLTLVVILAFGIVSLLVLAYVFGYELTQNDTDEGRILEICMNSDIGLDYCNYIYGGKDYGDAMK